MNTDCYASMHRLLISEKYFLKKIYFDPTSTDEKEILHKVKTPALP